MVFPFSNYILMFDVRLIPYTMASSYSATTVTPVSTRTPKFPVLRIMSGSCNSPIMVGNLTARCPCTGFTGTSKDGQLDIFCQKCLHPLTQHGDASSAVVDSIQQGSDQLKTSSNPFQYLSPRSETVSKLADLIDSQKVVHVRGTPASGKTTLARLLQKYYKAKKRNSIFIDTWRELDEYPSAGDDPYLQAWSKLDRMLRTRFDPNMDYLAPGTILIIDEAQKSYSDIIFWNSIIKPRLSRDGLDIRFCLFCSYGSPLSGVDRELSTAISFTPAHFTPAQRVTLTPQSCASSPSIGLFFTRSEFTDAAQQLIANPSFQEKFTLSKDAQDYLFSLTNGHPGGVSAVLQYIHDTYRHAIKSRDLSVLTKEHVVNSMKRDNDVWDKLVNEPISRSLPRGVFLTTDVANLLAKVLEEGNVPCESNKEAETCYKLGWLHKMQTLEEDNYEKEVYVLPSRLHEKHVSLSIHSKCLDCIILTNHRWIEHYIAKSEKNLPSEFQNLRDLTLAILREFSGSNLRNSAQGKKLSSGAQPKPIEAQYQDEFYRCFNKIAGRGVPVCTEWSRTTDGRVDFWIPGQKWAVEIVREQDRINEHIMRFHENGQYYPWRVDGMIQDWIIVNCTTSPPTCGYDETQLIHAVFKKDYAELEILDNQRKILQTSLLPN
ncbi:hypothetical protein BJX61DRAFT_510218 [Aspergillus egyptiacus]|nr:hypothetical protein BJX61DRAFT_510218 [Aspergillus egyptiacus]